MIYFADWRGINSYFVTVNFYISKKNYIFAYNSQ